MALTNRCGASRPRGHASAWTARTAAVSCAVALAGLLPATGAASAEPAAQATAAPSSDGRPFASPDTALGKSRRTSEDRSVIGTGDIAGFHILVADESDSFRYRELATLTQSGLDGIGLWTGYVCTTGSGRYAAAVYAPSTATNTPELTRHGAFAAVVDLETGKATQSITGVQLAYFSPGCGRGDTVTFTRSDTGDSAKGTTKPYDVDAKTGKTVASHDVTGQLTNPVPTDDGDLDVLGGDLVKVAADGSTAPLAKLPGRPFALTAAADGAVDLGVVTGGKDVLHRWDGKRLTRLGTAPLGTLGLHGRDLVAGDVSGIDVSKAPGLRKTEAPGKPLAASRQGHLLTTSAVSGAPFAEGYTGTAYVDAVAEGWHIELSERKKSDLDPQDEVPAVLYSAGSADASSDDKLSLSVTWSLSGELESLVCSAGHKAADHEKFLEDCAKLDHPKSRPASAATWLDGMLPLLDKSYRQNKRPVGSPLHRQGTAAFFLQAYNDGAKGIVYRLRVFGTDT
ncbi:hypothetical protein [Streptomyces sp. NPDC059894]|uniref:hypothetical protein n=1 Tax=unclassified Streptomyces TaxID=2593676 RepID=UPI003657C29C